MPELRTSKSFVSLRRGTSRAGRALKTGCKAIKHGFKNLKSSIKAAVRPAWVPNGPNDPNGLAGDADRVPQVNPVDSLVRMNHLDDTPGQKQACVEYIFKLIYELNTRLDATPEGDELNRTVLRYDIARLYRELALLS